MQTMRVGVLSTHFDGAGVSPVERELEETGRAVERALNALGHDARFVHADLATYDELQRERFDAVFNVCERIGGRSDREPHAAAMLEAVGVPYTGSPPITLATCMDKERVKDLLVFHGIPTPGYQVFRSGSEALEAGMEFPVIAKPAAADNSIGIGPDAVADDAAGLLERVKRLLDECGGPVLAEEFICGREFNVSILDPALPPVLPLGEIVYREEVFGSRGVCSYEAKWDEGSGLYIGDRVGDNGAHRRAPRGGERSEICPWQCGQIREGPCQQRHIRLRGDRGREFRDDGLRRSLDAALRAPVRPVCRCGAEDVERTHAVLRPATRLLLPLLRDAGYVPEERQGTLGIMEQLVPRLPGRAPGQRRWVAPGGGRR